MENQQDVCVLCEELGDCPNVEISVSKNQFLWQNIKQNTGWRLQQNFLSGFVRIIDENGIRKAWGNPIIMQEKFKRLTRKEFLEKGDIIGVVRSKAMRMYEHYAIYIGNHKVVHYAASGNDFDDSIMVRIATLEEFLKEDEEYFVLYFSKELNRPYKIWCCTSSHKFETYWENTYETYKDKKIRWYSAEETVSRALSRVGEEKYNLVTNNCEHFAVWCKTGCSESLQVRRVLYTVAGLMKLITWKKSEYDII